MRDNLNQERLIAQLVSFFGALALDTWRASVCMA